jgi:DNA-binding CsgD family transcriptional regulator
MTAAEAAHVAAKEERALELFRSAEENAQSPSEEREALWGQLMCMTELELEGAESALDDLAAGVPSHDARELLRESGRRLGLELKLGSLESLDEARERAQLLAHVKDAVVRTSFRCVFSIALTLDADYDLAAKVAEDMIADAEEHRLDFALPYGYAAAASAYAGSKRYADANVALELGLSTSRRMSNFHAEDNTRALQIRVLAQQGRYVDACAVEVRSSKRHLRSLRGELFVSRALALGCAGRFGEALDYVRQVRGTTGAIETRVLGQAVEAVVAIRDGRESALAQTELLLNETIASGGVDLLVTSYRASPELLAVLLGAVTTRERAWRLLIRAGDAEIASAAGYASPQQGDPLATLSRREREIYDLLCQGLSNKQIALCLFISEATVKAHVHHVYDKLGIRSRKALALEAARGRALYAAPTTTDGSALSGGTSS